MRRQSSRDLMRHKDRQLSGVISGQASCDVCLPSLDSRFTIRRDSINGLRIISKLDQAQTEALAGLTDIALNDDKTEFTKFQTDALKTHNMYRMKHGVADLVLCPDLCALSQQYADKLARTDSFQHSGDPDLGENLYWSWSSDPAWQCGGQEPVVSWYEESSGYCYDKEPRDSQSGHFTQLVWSQSSKLGVGVRKSNKTGKFYVVMKYDPPGNIIGSYTKHVHRPLHWPQSWQKLYKIQQTWIEGNLSLYCMYIKCYYKTRFLSINNTRISYNSMLDTQPFCCPNSVTIITVLWNVYQRLLPKNGGWMLLGRIESVVMTVHYDIKILETGLGSSRLLTLVPVFVSVLDLLTCWCFWYSHSVVLFCVLRLSWPGTPPSHLVLSLTVNHLPSQSFLVANNISSNYISL